VILGKRSVLQWIGINELELASMTVTADISTGVADATIKQLRRHAPFDRMDMAHMEFMAAQLKPAYFPNDAVIVAPEHGPPQYLYVIKQGAVMAGRVADDPGSGLAFHEGECFPLGAILTDRPVSNAYHSTQDTFCFLLPVATFHELLQRSPPFHSFCTQRIAHLLQQALGSLHTGNILSANGQQPLAGSLHKLLRRAAVTCHESTSVRDALAIMQRKGIGSLVVVDGNDRPMGIFTLHDLMNRVTLAGRSVDEPIGEVMTPNPVTLSADVFASEAALTMARHGVHHIVVMDGEKLAGVVSEKDLFSLQRVGMTQISMALRGASGLDALVEISRDIRELTRNLLAQGIDAEHLTQIISALNDQLSRRIIRLELDAAGLDADRFCWISLGSEGRQEQTFASDQDNGIIFSDPENSPEAVRALLLPVATRINAALDVCGFPLCRGEIMASNPRWCLSEIEWRQAFRHWINEGDPEAVLNATIFFDFRPLYGQLPLAEELRSWLAREVANNHPFLRMMAENALQNRPPLGVLRDFTLPGGGEHPHTIDLKVNGATLFIDAVRVLALASGVVQTNSARRLQAWAAARSLPTTEVDAWIGGFQFLQLTRLRHQQKQIAKGETPDNYLNPDHLNDLDRRILKEALRQARMLQGRLALDFQL
jgi:CBS domain-containing protein